MIENIEKPSQGKVTGVIIPPPEIRAVVDKTAQYVAKAGKSFEQRILDSKEGKTAKFNFMKLDDPYHAYYELKIREAEEAIAAGKDPAALLATKPAQKIEQVQPAAQAEPSPPPQPKQPVATTARAQPVNLVAKFAQDKPENEPYPLEFILQHPKDISPLDMEIIKLTAQYTAVNGRDFLASIAQREQRNPQFDFLKPTHMLFSYFTSLVDSYAKIVNPSPQLLTLVKSRTEEEKVFEYAVHRWSWKMAAEEKKRREENQADEDKLAFQAIDWNDFAVVEVIDFPEDELFEIPGLGSLGINGQPPPPATTQTTLPPPPVQPTFPTPVSAPAPTKPQSVPMFVDESNEEEDNIKIVSNYQPRITGQAASSAPLMVIDPVSGKPVPIEQLEDHMRIQLLDPRWKEEQKRFLEKQKETGFAEGSSIADSLRIFARKRGDIFGQSTTGEGKDSAAAIAELEAAERRKAELTGTVQWDGFFASIPATQQMKSSTADSSMSQMASQTMNSSGLPVSGPASFGSPPPLSFPPPPPMPVPNSYLPPPPPPPALSVPPSAAFGLPPPPPPPPPTTAGFPFAPPSAAPAFIPAPPPMGLPPMAAPGIIVPSMPTPSSSQSEEMKAKKPRIDSSSLIPAEEFAAIYSGPCSIEILLPSDPSNAQFNLNGQKVTLQVSVTTTIKELKEMLSTNHLNQMGTSKIQLKHVHHGFLKDVNSLASFNLGNGTQLEMSVKSRGGKR